MKIVPQDEKEAIRRVFRITLHVFIILFFLELPIFNGKSVSSWMVEFMQVDEPKWRATLIFTVYHLILYLCVTAYAVSALYIFVKRNSKTWSALIIAISVIFVVFVNVYLTVILRLEDETSKAIYAAYVSCFPSIALIISAVAGFKMNKNLSEGCPPVNNDQEKTG